MIFIHMTSHLCRNLCLLLSECNLSRDALDDNKDDLTGYSEFGKMAWEAKTQMCLTGKKASLSIYVLNTDNFQLDRGLFWSGLVWSFLSVQSADLRIGSWRCPFSFSRYYFLSDRTVGQLSADLWAQLLITSLAATTSKHLILENIRYQNIPPRRK